MLRLNGEVFRLKMDSNERVAKKSKSSYCIELHQRTQLHPCVYLLCIESKRWLLLDRHWEVLYDDIVYPKRVMAALSASDLLEFPCRISEDIERARNTLGPDVFRILSSFYLTENSKWYDYVNFGYLPPPTMIINSDCMDQLLNNYEKASSPRCRELFLILLFRYLRVAQEGFVGLHCTSLYFTSIIAILTWKGYASWYPTDAQYFLFKKFINKEEESLVMIAMARNRPKGQNFFAQMPRDVFRLILDWSKWSLPFNISSV